MRKLEEKIAAYRTAFDVYHRKSLDTRLTKEKKEELREKLAKVDSVLVKLCDELLEKGFK